MVIYFINDNYLLLVGHTLYIYKTANGGFVYIVYDH